MEMRRLADLLEQAEAFQALADEQSAAFRASADPTAAWIHDVRRDSCLVQAGHLRARFAAEVAELFPLLLSYAEIWSAAERRAA